MTIKAKILETLDKIPLSLQEELLHYAEYLQDKYVLTQDNNDKKLVFHKRILGQDKGLFTVPDDFNDRLSEDLLLAFEGESNDVKKDFSQAWHEAMT